MKTRLLEIWKRLTRSQAGFTLAELLVVVGIIVGLAAVILPNVGRFTSKGDEGSRATELSSVQTAIDSWAAEPSNDVSITSPDTGGGGNTLGWQNDFSAASGNINLIDDVYLRLPSGSTLTLDSYCWDNFGTVWQQTTNVGNQTCNGVL